MSNNNQKSRSQNLSSMFQPIWVGVLLILLFSNLISAFGILDPNFGSGGNQEFAITQSAATVIPSVSVNNVSLSEGSYQPTRFFFTISLSAAAEQPVSVSFTTANGTAIAGEDYSAASGTLTFAPGETSKSPLVTVIGDNVIESDETFTVNLSNAVNATISGDVGTGTILNDDRGGFTGISSSNKTVNENAGIAVVTVYRLSGEASGVSVDYSTSDGTAIAGQDYTATSGTLTFAANEVFKTFTVSILNDSDREQSETINLTLSNPNGLTLNLDATTTLTIIDDEMPPFSINNVSDREYNSGTTAFNFTVSLSSPSSETTRVDFATADGTATAPSDYQATSGSLIFPPGTTTQTITVLVNGDTQPESTESFTVNLSNAVNSTILNARGTGTIQDDDTRNEPPSCTYSVSPTNINVGSEASSNNSFSVSTPRNGIQCYFSVSTIGSFITITSSAGNSGNGGPVTFSVSANTGAARTGTILLDGRSVVVTVNQAAGTNVPRKVLFDFDGDGKSDVSVFRPDNGIWYQLNSTAGFSARQFGIPTDKIAPADFDGDGKTDFAVFRDGNWYLQRSSAGFASIPFGSPGDIPAPADFDGDGKAELVVFRPSNGYWYALNLTNNQFSSVQFGVAEDTPVAADYDGDGKSDYAVYRPSNGVWYMLQSTRGFGSVQFGISTDNPVIGDFDGDGKSDQSVYRSSNSTWYIFGSSQGFSSTQFGLSTDLPAAADFDGDGKTDIAVFRPDSGTWYQMKSEQGFGAVQFGANGDKPIPNAFIP